MSASPADLVASTEDGTAARSALVTDLDDTSLGRLHPYPAAVLALAGGTTVWAAFPGRTLWWLAPIGVALIALAVRGQGLRRAAWLGLLAGWAMFVPLLAWSGVYVGKLPWFALATLEALYVAGMATLTAPVWRLLSRATRAGGLRSHLLGAGTTVLGISGLWVLQEALRSRTPFGGFPWARLAFSQTDGPLLGVASLGGAPAVSALVALIGGCLAVALTALAALAPLARRATRTDRQLIPAATGAVLAVAVLAVLAAAAIPRPTDGVRDVQVAAVQGNVPAPGLDFNAERRAVLDNHARATTALADQVDAGTARRPDVVLWPENASDIDPTRNPDAAMVIQTAVDRIGVPVVVGAVLQEPPGHLSNVSIVWGPSLPAPGTPALGSPGAVTPGKGEFYVKRHPAPFGEYMPYRSFFRIFSDKVDLITRDFVAGTRPPVLTAGGVRLGDIICFEVAYDDLVRDGVRRGAEVLLVQTNNATFGFTDESVQQLAMSRLRAVESGRAVVHISTVGVSALIAPDGRLIQRSGHFTTEVLQAAIPVRHAQTVATTVGAWPEGLLAVAGLLLAVAGWRPRRRPAPVPESEEPA